MVLKGKEDNKILRSNSTNIPGFSGEYITSSYYNLINVKNEKTKKKKKARTLYILCVLKTKRTLTLQWCGVVFVRLAK